MANQLSGDFLSRPANTDLSASDYCGVDINSTGKVILATGAGATIVGVLQNANDCTAAGKTASVKVKGVTKMKLGGTVAIGDKVRVDASGRAVTASAQDVLDGKVIGKCLTGGAVNNFGTVLLGIHAVGQAIVSALDSIAAPGALSVYTEISELSVDGTDAFTLADGLYVGQRKIVMCVAAANTPVGTLTPATTAAGAPTEYIFSAVGQEVTLQWAADGWKCVGGKTAGADAPAQGATPLRQLVAVHVLSIDGTDDWILEDGIFPGQIKNFIVAAAANTPVGTVSGLFYDNADGSADGTDLAINAAADAAMMIWNGVRWFPVGLVSATT